MTLISVHTVCKNDFQNHKQMTKQMTIVMIGSLRVKDIKISCVPVIRLITNKTHLQKEDKRRRIADHFWHFVFNIIIEVLKKSPIFTPETLTVSL